MKKILAISLAVAFCFSEQFRTEKSYEKVDFDFKQKFFSELKENLVVEKIYNENNVLTSIKKYLEETNELVYLEEFDNGMIKSKTSFITTLETIPIAGIFVGIVGGVNVFSEQYAELLMSEHDSKCLGKPERQLLYDENGFLEMVREFTCNELSEKKYLIVSETPFSYDKNRNESLPNGIQKFYNSDGKVVFELSYKFGKLDGESKKYCENSTTQPCNECENSTTQPCSKIVIVKYKDGKRLDDAIPY